MSRRLIPILSVVVLVVSMLACNLSGGSTPATAEPSSVPSEVPSGSSSTGGACDNPLYPVAVGVSWSYSMTSTVVGNFTRSIIAVDANGFKDQDVFTSGVTRTGEWKCESGALIALQPDGGPSGVVQTSGTTAEFQTTAMSGVTLPAAVVAGTSWTQNFTLEGTESINGQSIAAKNVTAYSCTGGGTESVTVPAGTFNAVRVDCQTDMTITVTVSGVEVPTNVSTTSTTWYAPGIGMVKSDNVISGAENNTIELTAYTIP
jgi:uncharacterized protein DUF3108